MDLFAWSNADDLVPCSGYNGVGNVQNRHGGNLLDVDLAALHVLESMPHQLHALFKGDHETRHSRIGNRQLTGARSRHEERNYRAARTHYIAVAHDGKAGLVDPGVRACSDEQLVGRKLGCTIKVYGIAGLIGG